MSHDSLTNYYVANSFLIEHNYSLTEIETMLPYEKEIYLSLLLRSLEAKNEALQQAMEGNR